MTSGENWTKGPWRHGSDFAIGEFRGHVYAPDARFSDRLQVAACCGASSTRHDLRDEQIANAQLISASPDLYEALRDLLAITNESRGVAGWNLNGDDEPWGKFPQFAAAEAALAKARGEVSR